MSRVKTYTVEWIIQWDAETPQKAVDELWEMFFKENHGANSFIVYDDETGEKCGDFIGNAGV